MQVSLPHSNKWAWAW